MEPACAVSGVQPEAEAWRGYFGKVVGGWIGQERGWLHAALTTEVADLFVLPTGYGKTLAGVGVYIIKRGRRLASRLLWVVPTNALRDQLVPDDPDEKDVAQEAADFFGVPMRQAVRAERVSRTLNYHRQGTAEVFVVSYQQVLADAKDAVEFYRELLEMPGPDGRPCHWMVVLDEAHRLSEAGKWGAALQDLPFAYRLYLSATPLRTDRQALRGVPSRTTADGDLTYRAAGAEGSDRGVEISISDAVQEGAIRAPRARIEQYFIDTLDNDGKRERVTTELLARNGVTNFADYETRKGLRYDGTYLSKMLTDAVGCLEEKLLRQPDEHQLLAFAMTCKHAEAVTDHLNAISEGSADWIGQVRPEAENRAILRRFKRNQLRCLVQIDMASEGFNVDRCSVLVFLNLIRSDTRHIQQLGRGLRRNRRLARAVDVCDVFASGDTPLAVLLRELDVECQPYRDTTEDTDRDTREPTVNLPDLTVLETEWYRTDIFGPQGQPHVYEEWMQRAALALGKTLEEIAQVAAFIPGAQPAQNGAARRAREHSDLILARDRVLTAARTVARVLQQVTSPPGVVDMEKRGRFIRRIHAEWKRHHGGHDDMDAGAMNEKYKWIQSVGRLVNERRFPDWLVRGEDIQAALGGGIWPRKAL